MLKLSQIVGLPGLPDGETPSVRKVFNTFNWILIIIGLWLPIQYYLQARGFLPWIALRILDWLIWFSIFIEAVVITCLVKKKMRYLFGNWMNLCLIVIAFPVFWLVGSSYFISFRYLRVLILLRLIYPVYPITRELLARNSLGITLLVVIILTVLGGILLSIIDPAIGSFFIGIWFAAQTVSTVGYGSPLPTTIAGKLFALLLMIVGIGLFSVLTANLSSFLIMRKKPKLEEEQKPILENLGRLEEQLIALEERLLKAIETKKDAE